MFFLALLRARAGRKVLCNAGRGVARRGASSAGDDESSARAPFICDVEREGDREIEREKAARCYYSLLKD